jgi:hypothetical protein
VVWIFTIGNLIAEMRHRVESRGRGKALVSSFWSGCKVSEAIASIPNAPISGAAVSAALECPDFIVRE